ncbi:MAG: amidohydrolase family protein, partial [Candidatus Zipacnadales bacterium]
MATADETRHALKREAITQAIVSSLPAVLYKNPQEGNVQLVEEISQRSRFFIPFAVLNPAFPGWREDLRRCAEELGLKGLRLYPNYQQFSLRSRETKALVQAATELGWVTCVSIRLEDERFHHWRMKVKATPVDQLGRLVLDMPEATIVLSGGNYAELAT